MNEEKIRDILVEQGILCDREDSSYDPIIRYLCDNQVRGMSEDKSILVRTVDLLVAATAIQHAYLDEHVW